MVRALTARGAGGTVAGMLTIGRLRENLDTGGLDTALARLYPATTLDRERARIGRLLDGFRAAWGDGPADLISAPGRTELGGNHTDHNNGRVLAGAVTLDALAVVSPAADIRIRSRGYPEIALSATDLARRADEEHTPTSVVRGVLARLAELGHKVGGFHAAVESSVPEGSGLSSSASFEILVTAIQNHLYNAGRIDPVEAALVGQYAENVYFGKPSGLMDQTTSAVGGVVTIDFRDVRRPVVRKVRHAALDLALVVVNTGGNHAGLTAEYAAIRSEMEEVARHLGAPTLGEADPARLPGVIPAVREKAGDRAVLRALHFFGEQARVPEQARCLESGELARYLELVNESGRSSWVLNQNCWVPGLPRSQPIPLALALSERILAHRGAWRVHGGGFAGTIQAYVPRDLLPSYLATLRGVFGADSCMELTLRERGAGRVLEE